MQSLPEAYLNQFHDQPELLLVGPLAGADTEVKEPVIFVDGGSIHREAGVGISVGDGDSSSEAMDQQLDPVKDFSDLSFALGLIGEGFDTIHLNGFLGGRRDHELFNLGEVHGFLRDRSRKCVMLMDDDVVAFSGGIWRRTIHGLFSLAVLESSVVTLSGACEYAIPANTRVRPLSSYGLSNIGSGEIVVESDGPVFLFVGSDAE